MKTLFFALLLSALTLFGDQSFAEGSLQKPDPAIAAGSAIEVAVLRAQLETTKQFQDSFITMAQWTLGTAVAVALAMAVFGWHTNKTNYERDREAIARESRTAALGLKAEIEGELATRLATLESALAGRDRQIVESAVKQVGGKLSAFAGRLSSIEGAVDDLKESELEREAAEWMAKGVQANAITSLTEILSIHIRRGSTEYFSSQVLDKIRVIAKDPAARLGADAISQVLRVLERLSPELKGASEPIVALLKKKMG